MKNQLIEVFPLEANIFNWFENIFWLIRMLWKTMVKRISLKCDFFPWKLIWSLFILYVGFTWLTPYFSTSLCFSQVHSIWYYFIASNAPSVSTSAFTFLLGVPFTCTLKILCPHIIWTCSPESNLWISLSSKFGFPRD